MKLTAKQLDLITAYLNQALSPSEKVLFEIELEKNPTLMEEVDFQTNMRTVSEQLIVEEKINAAKNYDSINIEKNAKSQSTKRTVNKEKNSNNSHRINPMLLKITAVAASLLIAVSLLIPKPDIDSTLDINMVLATNNQLFSPSVNTVNIAMLNEPISE